MKSFVRRLRSLTRRDEGASAVEYALLVAGIALVMIVGAFLLGDAINDQFTDDASCVASVPAGGC